MAMRFVELKVVVVVVVVVMVGCLLFPVRCQTPFFPISRQDVFSRGTLFPAIPGASRSGRGAAGSTLSVSSSPYSRPPIFSKTLGVFSQPAPRSVLSPIFGSQDGPGSSSSTFGLLDSPRPFPNDRGINGDDRVRRARTQLPSERVTRQSSFPSLARNHPFSSIRLNPVPTSKGVSMTRPQNEDLFDRGRRNNRLSSLFDSDMARKYSLDAPSTFEKPINRKSLPDVNSPIQMDLASDEQERVAFAKQNGQLPPSRGLKIVPNEERPRLSPVFGNKGLGSRRLSHTPIGPTGSQHKNQQEPIKPSPAVSPQPSSPRGSSRPSASDKSWTEAKPADPSREGFEPAAKIPTSFDETSPFDEPLPRDRKAAKKTTQSFPESREHHLNSAAEKAENFIKVPENPELNTRLVNNSDQDGENRKTNPEENADSEYKIRNNHDDIEISTVGEADISAQNGVLGSNDKTENMVSTESPLRQTPFRDETPYNASPTLLIENGKRPHKLGRSEHDPATLGGRPENKPAHHPGDRSQQKPTYATSSEVPFIQTSEERKPLHNPLSGAPDQALNVADSLVNVRRVPGHSDSTPDSYPPNNADTPAVSPTSDQVNTPAVSPTSDQVNTPAVSPTSDQVDTPAVSPTSDQVDTPAVSPTSDQVDTPAVSLSDKNDIPAVSQTSDKDDTPAISPTSDQYDSGPQKQAEQEATERENYKKLSQNTDENNVKKNNGETEDMDKVDGDGVAVFKEGGHVHSDTDMPPPIDAIPPGSRDVAVLKKAVGHDQDLENGVDSVKRSPELVPTISDQPSRYPSGDANDKPTVSARETSLTNTSSKVSPPSLPNGTDGDVTSTFSSASDVTSNDLDSANDLTSVSKFSDNNVSMDSNSVHSVNAAATAKSTREQSPASEGQDDRDPTDPALEQLAKTGQGHGEAEREDSKGGAFSVQGATLSNGTSVQGADESRSVYDIDQNTPRSTSSRDLTSPEEKTPSDHSADPSKEQPQTQKDVRSSNGPVSGERAQPAPLQTSQEALQLSDVTVSTPSTQRLSEAAEEFLSLSNRQLQQSPSQTLSGSQELTSLSEEDLLNIPKDLEALEEAAKKPKPASREVEDTFTDNANGKQSPSQSAASPFQVMFGRSLQDAYRQSLGSLFGNLYRAPSQSGAFAGIGVSGGQNIFGQGGPGEGQKSPVADADSSRGVGYNDYSDGRPLFDAGINSIISQRPSLRLFGERK